MATLLGVHVFHGLHYYQKSEAFLVPEGHQLNDGTGALLVGMHIGKAVAGFVL